MQTYTPLVGSPRNSDPQVVKQWAAEDFAIAIGLLRECPYHGQPIKVKDKSVMRQALAVDPADPIVKIFGGNTHELLAAVEQVAGTYAERCPLCVASEEEAFD